MSDEILAVAVFVPLPGNEEAAMATIRVLMSGLARGGYSRDFLYRDTKSGEYVLVRYWKSEEARRAALEDPELLRCWAELAHQIKTIKVHEILESVHLDGQPTIPKRGSNVSNEPQAFADHSLDPPVRGFLHRPQAPSGDGMVPPRRRWKLQSSAADRARRSVCGSGDRGAPL